MEGVSFWSILKSRKFWVMVLAIVTAASLFATQQIDGWQFLLAVITSVAAYSTGVAIEDAGAKVGAAKNQLDKIPGIMSQQLKDLKGSPSIEGRQAYPSGPGRVSPPRSEDIQG